MKSFIVASLAGLALAAPAAMPQDSLDLDLIDSAPVPEVQGPPVQAANFLVTVDADEVFASAYNAAATAPATASATAAINPTVDSEVLSTLEKRGLGVNDPCGPQPKGYGAVSSPDTFESFASDPQFPAAASSAPTPDGYSLAFSGLNGETEGNGFLGVFALKTYDPTQCQMYCDAADGCYGFNVLFERDPSVNPAAACQNPKSYTNIKCTLWGYQITSATATNVGQWRENFHVGVAGSNGYSKNAAPPSQPNFTGPIELGGTINAPDNSFMTSKFYTGPYDPSQCAAACQGQTAYNQKHPRSDGSYDSCIFFNSFVTSKNNVPQGTYCSLYTKVWGKQYAVNTQQTRGGNRYTNSQSYGYVLNTQ